MQFSPAPKTATALHQETVAVKIIQSRDSTRESYKEKQCYFLKESKHDQVRENEVGATKIMQLLINSLMLENYNVQIGFRRRPQVGRRQG